MMKIPTIAWIGASGRQYMYYIYPISKSFTDDPVNFIFAKKNRYGIWLPCLIGETDNLKKYLRRMNTDFEFQRLGATHIHYHVAFGTAAERKAEAQDLIRQWMSAGNEMRKRAEGVGMELFTDR